MVMPVADEAHAVADESDGSLGLEPPEPGPKSRWAVSGWFTTSDHGRALAAESMVVSMQPCNAAPPLFNT